MALTPKQQRFVDEYLVDLNATRAYRASYPSVKKDETAAAAATRLLKNVKVSAYISERMQARQQRTEITQDYVLQKLKEITDQKASDAQDSELKYANKIRALELLGKHLGLFEKKSEPQQTVHPLVSDLMQELKRRNG